MTDSTTDGPTGNEQPRSDDDVVSAMLDGEATPHDMARVESNPALQRRLDSFRSVRDRLATVPPAPPALVDAHVAAALDEFSAVTDGSTEAGAGGPVPLAEIRRSWWQRVPLGAVAAAAAAVVFAGVLGLTAGRDGDDAATGAFDSAAGTVAADADTADSDAIGAVPTDDSLAETMTSPAPATETAMADAAAAAPPEFSSTDDLAAFLRDALAEPSATSTTDRGQPSDGADDAVVTVPDPCGAVALLDLDPAAVRLVVSAVVDGSPVTAVVHDSEDRLVLTVLDDSSCQVVVERPL